MSEAIEGDDAQSIIVELNTRFQELRTLLITIGSILAMLIAGLNQVGFIDYAVDRVVDMVEDDPDLNPYLDDCMEDWDIIVDYYIVEDDILFAIEILDYAWCNNVHTVDYNITVDGLDTQGTTNPFRNTNSWIEELEGLSEGTHHAVIEVTNGTIDLFYYITLDFEYDEGEQQQAVYGCTDPVALNYNETATNEDGSCEYEQEEEEVTDDCYANFYEAKGRWSVNNTSLYNDFDVDFSCMANVTVTVTVTVYSYDNTTILYNASIEYETYHYDWDYHYLDFVNATYYDKVNIQYRVYHEEQLDDETWYWLEA
jgi:hypothetical protein